MPRKTFLSFHYQADHWRVSQIKNMGAIEEQPILSSNEWEAVQRRGEQAIKDWINENLRGKSCLIVLIGAATAQRKWVNYEIKQAFDSRKGVLGIYVHKLKDQNGYQAAKGNNPFDGFTVNGQPLSNYAKTYDPPQQSSGDVYAHIKDNIGTWIETAIALRG